MGLYRNEGYFGQNRWHTDYSYKHPLRYRPINQLFLTVDHNPHQHRQPNQLNRNLTHSRLLKIKDSPHLYLLESCSGTSFLFDWIGGGVYGSADAYAAEGDLFGVAD